MPLYSCDIANCRKPGIRQKACLLCNRRLCVTHLKPEHHTCPHWTTDEAGWEDSSARAERDEITALIARINLDALIARASALRGGIPCMIPPLSYEPDALLKTMGGMNYHVNVHFEDGVTWFCRILRRNATSPPLQLQNRVILSEAATLQFLSTTLVPVPKVHDVAIESPENAVGVGYILMDKLPGKPLIWDTLDDVGKRRILEQMVEIFKEIAKHPFSSIGCLERLGPQSVGSLVRDNAADKDSNGQLCLLGPFTSTQDYRTSFAEHQLELIRKRELYPNHSVDAYLVYRYLLECIPSIVHNELESDRSYYLKHMDDKGDHILVDDCLTIVGIVDWEWAQTTSRREAFAAPLFLLDVGAFYDGQNELSGDEGVFASLLEEAGCNDLAALARNGRIEHRLTFCLEADVDDEECYPALFLGLRRVLGVAKHDDPKEEWKVWRHEVLAKYRKDVHLQALLSER